MRVVALIVLILLAPPLAAQRIDLIDAEIFGVDRSHSHLGFAIGFLGMTSVRGTFKAYQATVLYDDARPERSSITLAIDANTIDTGNTGRDKDLQGGKWFDTANHPRITFQSTSIERRKGNTYLLRGDLTIKGVTRAIAIPVTRTVPRGADKGWGNIRIGGTGQVTIKRKDFGITGNEFWGEALGDEVAIEIDLLGNRFNYDRWNFDSSQKPSIGTVLLETADKSGGAAAAEQFRSLRRDKPDHYNFAPSQVLLAANRLLQHGRASDAVALLTAAIEAHPDAASLHDRAGEAYAMLGRRADAVRMYEKSQALGSTGSEATAMLRALREAFGVRQP